MTEQTPEVIPVPVRHLRELAIECWRLQRAADAAAGAGRAHGLGRIARSMTDIIEALGIVIVDAAGRRYAPGLAAEVIDVREEEGCLADELLIDETVRPTLLWRGQLLDPGQIVVKRAPQADREQKESKA